MGPGLNGRRALLRFLQRRGRLSPADADRLEKITESQGTPVADLLARENLISEADLPVILADALKLTCVEVSSLPLEASVVRLVRDVFAQQNEVLPISAAARTVELAMANPLDLEAIKAVEFATGRRVQPVVVARRDLCHAIARAYRLEDSLEQLLTDQGGGSEGRVEVTELREESIDLRRITTDADLPPVVRLTDVILVEGTKLGASDVHVEPTPDGGVVRYRIDGILEEAFRYPRWVQAPLTTRFKVMAKLDIAERRVPQDGRLQVKWQDRLVDFRVSSLPTQHGEKITLRILDSGRTVKTLDTIGFSTADLRHVRDAIGQPQGMVLVTGPTGSGKTTTLYAVIREIYSPTRNIVTIENPIEYQLKGINQVEIREKQGLTFASVLRSVLRQDPDVILVGEIRDAETARIAFQAAQTGHLVLSTLHTNDAAATVTRLLDLGIEAHVVASSVNLLMAQRLVRRICSQCAMPDEVPDEVVATLHLEEIRGQLRRGRGCGACRSSGYAGRLGVYEIIPVTAAVAKLIESGAGESALRRQARAERRRTLREDAIGKIAEGVTTPTEVLRVIQVAAEADVPPPTETRDAADAAIGTDVPLVVPGPRSGPIPDVVPASTEPARPARTFKALVVDDEPSVRHIVQLMLESGNLGLTVITAKDGEEGLALAAQERPDVIVLDRAMPGIEGFEVCRLLRADPATANTPIMMLTAHDAPELIEIGFAAGADDYVVKPVRREVLVARVRRMLERTYGPDGVPPRPARPAASEERP